jgi:hypothetical protein
MKIMKNLLIILFVFSCLNSFSKKPEKIVVPREVKYSDFSGAENLTLGQITSYVYKDGNTYKVGDKLKLCQTSMNGYNKYAYIREFIPFLTNEQLNIGYSGTEVEIKSLWLEGSKKYGYAVAAICKGNIHVRTLDQAVEAKEVKLVGVLSSDEALSSLKKAKDKLELGLITQAKYDSLKLELTKFIK